MFKEPLNERAQVLLAVLIALNTALLVASNAAGSKMIHVFGNLTASATVFSYALSFAITDVISELFGPKRANLAVRITFVGMFVSVIIFMVSIMVPGAAYWQHQRAFETTLGLSARMLAGGWTAYMVSQHLDVWLFHKIRSKTGTRFLWLRNNGSTLISQFVDTCIFMTFTFYGVFPIWEAILGQYFLKLVIAVLDTPLVYLAIHQAKRYVAEKDFLESEQ